MHLEVIGGWVQAIRGAIENPDFVDTYVLKRYLDKITSLGGELQELKEMFFLEDVGDCV